MCGLIAMITKTPGGFHYKAGETFSQLLYAGALRGMDSTGVFGINKYGNLKLHKAATPSAEFMRTKTFENFDKDIFNNMRVVVACAKTGGAIGAFRKSCRFCTALTFVTGCSPTS